MTTLSLAELINSHSVVFRKFCFRDFNTQSGCNMYMQMVPCVQDHPLYLPSLSLSSSRETYNALTNWLTDARTLASPNIVIVLVGNKKDLEADREVTFMEASRFAQENGTYLPHVPETTLILHTRILCLYCGTKDS